MNTESIEVQVEEVIETPIEQPTAAVADNPFQSLLKGAVATNEKNKPLTIEAKQIITEEMCLIDGLTCNGIPIESGEQLFDTLNTHVDLETFKKFNIAMIGPDDKKIKSSIGVSLPDGTFAELSIKYPNPIINPVTKTVETPREYRARNKNRLHMQYLLALNAFKSITEYGKE